MHLYGIIGFPLTHSFSKQYFNDKIEREKIPDAFYESFPLVSIDEFPALLNSNPSLRGLSVTIPYKEQILRYVSQRSDDVIKIGAANCIKVREGNLTAFNTDITGFEESFIKELKPNHNKALVLGTGGSSKAVQYVLEKLGISFLVVSRSNTRSVKVIRYQELTEGIIGEHTVIINCTPLGMSPDDESCPDIPYQFLTTGHYLYDLVYVPEKTLFLKKGEDRGVTIKNGYEMLVIQAEVNWKIWNED